MKKTIKATIIKAIDFTRSPRGESIRYIIIGGCTTLVDYCTHYVLSIFLNIDFNVSNFVSTSLAIVFAYITNKYIVFGNRTSNFRDFIIEFFKFIGSRLFTLGIEIGAGYLFVTIMGQYSLIGKVEAIVIVIIVNYFLSKFLVFRNKPSK